MAFPSSDDTGYFRQFNNATADEFLDYLSPQGPIFRSFNVDVSRKNHGSFEGTQMPNGPYLPRRFALERSCWFLIHHRRSEHRGAS